MNKAALDKYVEKLVCIELYSGGVLMGKLEFVPRYSAKYDFRHSQMYYIGTASFKAEHVKTIRPLEGGEDGNN